MQGPLYKQKERDQWNALDVDSFIESKRLLEIPNCLEGLAEIEDE